MIITDKDAWWVTTCLRFDLKKEDFDLKFSSWVYVLGCPFDETLSKEKILGLYRQFSRGSRADQ